MVDTRGGFAFESTDVCALADSFIVVTEPDITSFYQDRNLISRISHAAKELESPSLLRGIIVNKATDALQREDKPYLDNLEVSFRNELVKEFPIKFHETHPVPVDIEALLAYKVQRIPYASAPGSLFSFATLSAFSDILQIVTSRWSVAQVDKWNELVDVVSMAVKQKRKLEEEREQEKKRHEKDWEELLKNLSENEAKIASLQRELTLRSELHEREFERTKLLLESSAAQREKQHSESLNLESQRSKSKERLYTLWKVLSALSTVALLAYTISTCASKQYDAAKQQQATQEQQKQSAELLAAARAQADKFNAAQQAAFGNSGQKTSPPVADSISGTFAVLLSNDMTLQPTAPDQPSAAFEAELAHRLGYTSVSIYENQGMYTMAVLFTSEIKARQAAYDLVSQFFSRWKSAQVVRMNSWCPSKSPSPDGPIVVQDFSVPVWKCLSTPAPLK